VSKPSTPYHRIRSVEFRGGFLRGTSLEFGPNLNCVIGGRGTGKTTVLEAIRFALKRLPEHDKRRRRKIESLIEANLGNGTVRVEIETQDGSRYYVERGRGEEPLVTDAKGEPVALSFDSGLLFDVDVFSQHEIEEIATDPRSQLTLLDRFVSRELRELEEPLRDTVRELNENLRATLRKQRRENELRDDTRDLPNVRRRLQELTIDGDDERSDTLRGQNEFKRLREAEVRFSDRLGTLCETTQQDASAMAERTQRDLERALAVELDGSPNVELTDHIREVTERRIRSAIEAYRVAEQEAEIALETLKSGHETLAQAHLRQEKNYRDTMDAFEEDRERSRERVHLENRQATLEDLKAELERHETDLLTLAEQRTELRTRLSDLRDKRYELRAQVARQLSEDLAPLIRIRVEPLGNRDAYRDVLTQALRGSRLRYGTLVSQIVKTLSPAELAGMIQREDREALRQALQIEADRATRLIMQLKDSEDVCTLETVELHDKPVIELRDGNAWKSSEELSTGQKCTTVLPILLLRSERPLVIDQPEDNLDNAFVYETIVTSILAVRDRRQLVFATHNPNIPVLGEAARVFVLRSHGRSAELAKVGDVDELRGEIEGLLEGGSEAFRMRMERYGY